MRRVALIAAAILAVVLPSAAQAQNPIELGLDGALVLGLDSPHSTSLSIPTQRLRVGFFISPRVSIEPFGGLDHTSVDDNSGTSLNVGVGGLYHFGGVPNTTRVYVRPFADLAHSSFDTGNLPSESFNAFGLGAGVGVKIPFASRMSWCLEGALRHSFEHDRVLASTNLGAFFGFSFFTH